jgi:hypothetical protein
VGTDDIAVQYLDVTVNRFQVSLDSPGKRTFPGT